DGAAVGVVPIRAGQAGRAEGADAEEDRRVAAAPVVLAPVPRGPFRVVLVVLVGIGGRALQASGVAAARGQMLAAHRAAALRAVPRLGVVAVAEREQTALSHAGHRRLLLTCGLGR